MAQEEERFLQDSILEDGRLEQINVVRQEGHAVLKRGFVGTAFALVVCGFCAAALWQGRQDMRPSTEHAAATVNLVAAKHDCDGERKLSDGVGCTLQNVTAIEGPKSGQVHHDADWEKSVQDLKRDAANLKVNASKALEAAEDVSKEANAKREAAQKMVAEAQNNITEAKAMEEKAEHLKDTAMHNLDTSKKLEEKAHSRKEEAGSAKETANKNLLQSAELANKAKGMKGAADNKLKEAGAVEKKAHEEVAGHRVCVDIPAARLGDGTGKAFDPLVNASDVQTAEQCKAKCLETADCGQAVFSSWEKKCSMWQDGTDELIDAREGVWNSSYCGLKNQEDSMLDRLHAVYKKMPYVPPLIDCSWGGDDCSQTKCCNDVKCDVHFEWCQGYTCYKETEYFAGCRADAPPPEWQGDVVGGPRETREIPPADEGVLVAGTSLFCFSVISWDAPRPKAFWATEAELATHIKDNGLHIWKCDKGKYYSGMVTSKAEWGSFSNIDAFVSVWEQVRNDGEWQNYDWVVKVDSDAVFFPDRLQKHLTNLRTPKGSRVYIKNINYQFQFMGALEVISKEALELYFEKSSECIRGEHQGGEDYFMKLCLDSLGVDHQTDFDLLQDKYCLTCDNRDNGCGNEWTVAFHFHKKIISWDWCHNEAVCGMRAGDCPGGLKVEYVMP